MKKYRPNDWVYPDAIHRELRMDLKVIYDILEICVDNNIVEQYLNIYCPRCQRFSGNCATDTAESYVAIICSEL